MTEGKVYRSFVCAKIFLDMLRSREGMDMRVEMKPQLGMGI